jgi:hypothetical protein
MLIDDAEDRGPMLFARMGILEATTRRKRPPAALRKMANGRENPKAAS